MTGSSTHVGSMEPCFNRGIIAHIEQLVDVEHFDFVIAAFDSGESQIKRGGLGEMLGVLGVDALDRLSKERGDVERTEYVMTLQKLGNVAINEHFRRKAVAIAARGFELDGGLMARAALQRLDRFPRYRSIRLNRENPARWQRVMEERKRSPEPVAHPVFQHGGLPKMVQKDSTTYPVLHEPTHSDPHSQARR